MDELCRQVPKFMEFSFLQMRKAYVAIERRLSHMVNLTTEDRYNKFLQTYPDIIQRVSQHMIASYLELPTETLSRARKQITQRK